MKTQGVFWRYPRKISLLKDLQEGISRASLLHKSMKTGSGLRIPSKISLLKDLAEDNLAGRQGFLSGARLRQNLEIVKELKESLPLSNS
jgi:hypothetical protein